MFCLSGEINNYNTSDNKIFESEDRSKVSGKLITEG